MRTFGTQRGVLIDTQREKTFPTIPHIIRIIIVVYTVPILPGDIVAKTGGIEIFEFPIGYCGMPFNGLINGNFTKSIKKTMVT